jgi:hypothetical protein
MTSDFLVWDEIESTARSAAWEERNRILKALYRGEVQVLGKPVRLSWPEGEPRYLAEMIERL